MTISVQVGNGPLRIVNRLSQCWINRYITGISKLREQESFEDLPITILVTEEPPCPSTR